MFHKNKVSQLSKYNINGIDMHDIMLKQSRHYTACIILIGNELTNIKLIGSNYIAYVNSLFYPFLILRLYNSPHLLSRN